jgi:histidine triad (HIT) family protein
MKHMFHESDSPMTCTFCRIIDGNAPAFFVWRDTQVAAFLDVRPLFAGHVLVVPCHHVATLAELSADAIGPFFTFVQRVEVAVRLACDSPGTFVAMNNVVSQSVPHLHVHVVPRRAKDGLRGFFWPRTRYDDDESARSVAERIGSILRSAGDLPSEADHSAAQ